MADPVSWAVPRRISLTWRDQRETECALCLAAVRRAITLPYRQAGLRFCASFNRRVRLKHLGPMGGWKTGPGIDDEVSAATEYRDHARPGDYTRSVITASHSACGPLRVATWSGIES